MQFMRIVIARPVERVHVRKVHHQLAEVGRRGAPYGLTCWPNNNLMCTGCENVFPKIYITFKTPFQSQGPE